MRFLPHPALLVAACVLSLGGGAFGADAQFPVPSTFWKDGDVWRLSVDLYSRETPEEKKSDKRIDLTISVVGTEQVGFSPCRKLYFNPARTVSGVEESFLVTVDEEHGWLKTVRRIDGKTNAVSELRIDQIGNVSLLPSPPEGFPLELLFPGLEGREIKLVGSESALSLRKEVAGQQITMTLVLKREGREELILRQKWGKGERWWRECERFVNGRKALHARLTTIPGGQQSPPRTEYSAVTRTRPHADDQRLQVPVTLFADDPPLMDVLARLHEATGLTFAVAKNLDRHDPKLGDLQFTNAPVWSVMQVIAETDLEGGHWEKTDSGYLLVANSSLRERPPSFWERPLVLTTFALVGTLLFLVAVTVFKHRRLRVARAK
jgi:hypothetical protein